MFKFQNIFEFDADVFSFSNGFISEEDSYWPHLTGDLLHHRDIF